MNISIPLYDAAGNAPRARSLKCIHALIAAERVTVVRDRRGNIKRAYMRKADGRTSVLRTAYLGTKYSFREALSDGHFAFTLKKLGSNEPGRPDYLRPIFLNVITSCMAHTLSATSIN